MRSQNQPDFLQILKGLANGADPFTGEVLPSDSPVNEPQAIRALFWALDRCESDKASAVRGQQTKKSAEDRQRENMQKGLPQNNGLPWQQESRQEVATSFKNGVSIAAIAKKQNRTRGSITSELKRQGLISDNSANQNFA